MRSPPSLTSILIFVCLSLLPLSTVAKKKHVPLDLAIVHNNQGVSFLNRNDLDRAEVEFKTAVEIDPLYPEARNNLGLIYKYKGHFDRAIESFKKAIDLDPKWAAPYNHLGTVYLTTGDFGKAIGSLRKATEKDKKFADAWYNLGLVYLEKAKGGDAEGNWKEAVRAFQKSTTIDTRNFRAHRDLADTYRKLKEYEKAILRYRLAIETNPKDTTAWQHLGELYLETGDTQKAQECFGRVNQKNRAQDPGDPMTHFEAGFAQASRGRYQEAIRAYQESIRLQPDLAAAWYNLGGAFEALNDRPHALRSYCRFLSLIRDNASSPQFEKETKRAMEFAGPLGGCR